MIVAKYRSAHGSRIVIPLLLKADDGETVDEIAVSAWLRFADFPPAEATDDMPDAIAFTVETRDDKPGWLLIIPEADAAALAVGFYIITIKAGEDISDRFARLEIVEGAAG